MSKRNEQFVVGWPRGTVHGRGMGCVDRLTPIGALRKRKTMHEAVVVSNSLPNKPPIKPPVNNIRIYMLVPVPIDYVEQLAAADKRARAKRTRRDRRTKT